MRSVENHTELYESLLQGSEGLLKLASQVTRLNLGDVKALHAAKGDLLYPLTKIVECEAGRERYRREAQDGRMDPNCWDTFTACENPEIALLDY